MRAPSRVPGSEAEPVRQQTLAGVAAALAALVLLAVLSRVSVGGASLNYDAQWAVDWGQAIARGDSPQYDAEGAPTAHPLVTAVATIAGGWAPAALHWLAHLSHAALIIVAGLLAYRLFGAVAAGVAALGVAVCAPIAENVALGFQDVTTAALVLGALLADVERPGRHRLPLVLLALGGLIRPEVWGLAIAYWVWRGLPRPGRERLVLGVLALLGPLLWMLSDLVVTGDPLLSFTRTREGAAEAERTTGLAAGPGELVDHVRNGLGTVWAAGALAGAALVLLAWRGQRRREARVLASLHRRGQVPLVALWGLLVTAFLFLAAAELSLLERYVLALMAVTIVLFAFAAGGWWQLPSGTARWVWLAVAAILVIRAAASMPDQIRRIDGTVSYSRGEADALEELDRLVTGDRATAAIADCGRLAVSSYRTVPYAAFALDRQPADMPEVEDPTQLRTPVAWIAPRSDRAAAFTAIGEPTAPPSRPAGFTTAAANRDWALHVRRC